MLSLYACKVLTGLERQATDDNIRCSLAPEGGCEHILRGLLLGHGTGDQLCSAKVYLMLVGGTVAM